MAYLRNCWYVGGLAKELDEGNLLSRRLLDELIFFYRDSSGNPVAMRDQCPHRFVQLSMGKLKGDCIECPYHGLTFNSSGDCVHNPHGDGQIQARAKVQTYPVVERHTALWIWLGDAEKADASLIPEYDFLDTEHFYVGGDIMKIEGNYQLESDNILDLSHIEFVHPIFSSPEVSNGEYVSEVNGQEVWSKRDIYNDNQAPEFIHQVFQIPEDQAVDRWLHVQWLPPANMVLYSGGVISGEDRAKGIVTPGFHWFTPETETSTHYFFGLSFPKILGEHFAQAVDEHVAQLRVPFELEDKPIIESQQRNIGSDDFFDKKPIALSVDSAGVRARRILEKLIREEQG
jgi:vanillate O-demethylase monooxygenase subunit